MANVSLMEIINRNAGTYTKLYFDLSIITPKAAQNYMYNKSVKIIMIYFLFIEERYFKEYKCVERETTLTLVNRSDQTFGTSVNI